jgi:ABC-type branched-subunit amino acid transport system ATPase component
VRSSEVGAATSGVSPVRVKLALFGVSAAIAGIGGIMYAAFQTNVSDSTTPFAVGLLWLAVVVLFGIRRPAAAAYAGIASAMTPVIIGSGFHWWHWVPSWLSWNGTPSSEIPAILFGLGAVTLARSPDGFMAANAAQRYARRVKKEAAAARAEREAEAAAAEEEAAVLEETRRHSAQLLAEGAVRSIGDQADDAAGMLVVRDLRVAYGDVQVLHGVSLSVPEARITALFGANGSGKSTLCSSIAGLVPPSSGSITLGGEDITTIPAYRRVGRGVLVAPESRGIFPGLTVEENLMLRLGATYRAEVYSRFPVLGERRRIPAGSLSGGEQQMLTLAPLLVEPPRLVVVDEPTLGLAPIVIDGLVRLFGELRDRGTSILLVEEKVRDVLTIADHVAFIELGRIIWSGPRADVDNEQLIGAYLGAQM